MTYKLPILLSIPHGGLEIPSEVAGNVLLNEQQIIKDGDEGAREIYALDDHFEQVFRAIIARAFVDLNRATSDRRPDGVVKTHTCWSEQVYKEPLTDSTIDVLLEKYYFPYHAQLDGVDDSRIRLCVDCHTMAEYGPPIGPDADQMRPHVCLGDSNGKSLPAGWIEKLQGCFKKFFGDSVTVNEPFSGGYITRSHSNSRPWLQLELSRGAFMSDEQKRINVFNALNCFCKSMAWTQ